MGQQAQMLVDGQIDESTSQGKKQADDIKDDGIIWAGRQVGACGRTGQ